MYNVGNGFKPFPILTISQPARNGLKPFPTNQELAKKPSFAHCG